MNTYTSRMKQRQYTSRLTSTRNLYSSSLSGLPIGNLSGNILEPLGEQVDDLAVKFFAPTLFPLFKGVEQLEESPKISEGTRNILKLIEAGIGLFVVYKAIQWLDS